MKTAVEAGVAQYVQLASVLRHRIVPTFNAEAEGVVGRRKGQPTGLVRLATPVVFGRLHIVPLVAAFTVNLPPML